MELVTADAVDQLESAGCKIDNVQGFGTRFIMFNVAKEPWNNVKVRQAIMYALDTEKMVSNTFAGLATAASCYLPKSFTNYHEASTVYKTDAKKAKKLIIERGAGKTCVVGIIRALAAAFGIQNQLEVRF